MCASPLLKTGTSPRRQASLSYALPSLLSQGLRLHVRLVPLCYSMSVRSQNSSAGVTTRKIRNVHAWYWLLLTHALSSCWLYDRISEHLPLIGQSYILGPLMLQSIQRLRSPWHRAAHSFLLHFLHTRSKPSSIKRFLWKCLSQSTPSWCSHPHSKSALTKHELQNKWLLNEWNRSSHSIIGISRYLLSVGWIL